jgi:hypothetical protein
MHVSQEKQTAISKLSSRGMRYYVAGDTESSQILRVCHSHDHRVITSRDVVFPISTHRLESTAIESPADLPLDLDDDAPGTR